MIMALINDKTNNLTCKAFKSSPRQIAAKVVKTCSINIPSSASLLLLLLFKRAFKISLKYTDISAHLHLHLPAGLRNTAILIALRELKIIGFANGIIYNIHTL